MTNYYSDLLNSNKLRRCYEIAPIRVRRFLEAEYGRVAIRLLKTSKKIIGIDISKENIQLAKKRVGTSENCEFYTMDAIDLKFVDGFFDIWNIKAPFTVPDNIFMAIELVENGLLDISGVVKYPKEFEGVG